MSTSLTASPYLLLLRQPPGPPPPPEELGPIMARFEAWMERLRARHEVLGTHGLAPAGRVLRAGERGLSVTDGPYVEAHEVIGGYVLFLAASLDEAEEIARACPGLDHRMSVEVRPVLAHCSEA